MATALAHFPPKRWTSPCPRARQAACCPACCLYTAAFGNKAARPAPVLPCAPLPKLAGRTPPWATRWHPGHSAGAHLCAAVLAGMAGAEAAQAVAGAVLISGVYDLAPVAASYVNDVVHISPEEVRTLSPLFALPARDVPVHILIGQDEPEAFQVQSQALRQAWTPHLTHLQFSSLPGRDHFDVLDVLDVLDALGGLGGVAPLV